MKRIPRNRSRFQVLASRFVFTFVAVSLVTLSAQSKPAFEVASVKRAPSGPPVGLVTVTRTGAGSFYRRSETVARLIQFAYDVSSLQVVGGPEWIRRGEGYEINARTAGNASLDQIRSMVRSLLEERFTLVVRREQQPLRHYSLTIAKPGTLGPRLTKCDDLDSPPPPTPVRIPVGATAPVLGTCSSISALAAAATGVMAAPVVDRTGLNGLWNYELVFAGNQELTGVLKTLAVADPPPQFTTALQEQLGLRLEPGSGPIDVILVESVERPTEN